MSQSLKPVCVVADTNYFLHFQQPDQIDWQAYISAPEVKLVIPMTVIDELDKHKNAQSLKLRTRAKKVISKLREVLRAQDKKWGPSVTVEVLSDLSRDEVASFGLDPDRPDDRILALSIHKANTSGTDSEVFLLSNDFGVELKTEGRGIKLLVLPEELQLSGEEDAIEKENRELRKQNTVLLNRMPKLELSVNESRSRFEVSLTPTSSLSAEEIESKVSHVKSRHPLHVEKPLVIEKSNAPSSLNHNIDLEKLAQLVSGAAFALRPSKEQWDTYNTELEEFYEKYRKYLLSEQGHREIVSRSVFLDLYLMNSGTMPASDVRVKMHFPDGFELLEYDQFPSEPEKPAAPREPRANSLVEMLAMSRIPSGPSLGSFAHLQRNLEPINVRGFSIKPTNSFDVRCEVRKAMHGEPIFLRSVVAIFDSVACAESFTIDYQLICDELIETSEGQIHVIVKKS